MSQVATKVTVRPARAGDGAMLHRFVCELAEYEQTLDSVKITPENLEWQITSNKSFIQAAIAEVEGEAVGFALYFYGFSTWVGATMYLDDLYVVPTHRGRGVGRLLLEWVLGWAAEQGVPRVDWRVLDWNEPAQEFYKKMGAQPLDGWTTWRYEPRKK